MGDIRGETNTGLSFPFSCWPNPINQSTNPPVYHTQKTEINGPLPVPISAKKGKSFIQIKLSSSQNNVAKEGMILNKILRLKP